MKKKRLLIIPAKSNSQRIKNKNFKNFCGKPMIEYPIEASLKSKLFEKIHISTESEKIKKKLQKKNIRIDFLRPKKLCKDGVGLFEVYKFVVEKFRKQNMLFDEVWSILPCTPLIDHLDLLKLKRKIENNNIKKPIISISKYNAPIQWAFQLNQKNQKLIPLDKKKQILPSQNLTTAYYDVGSITVFDLKNFNTNKKFYDGNFYGFILPPEKSLDIDELEDWKFAEYLKSFKK